jgi:hypothetical protein
MNLFEQALVTGMAPRWTRAGAQISRPPGRIHDIAQEPARHAIAVQAQILGDVFVPTNGGFPLTGPTG